MKFFRMAAVCILSMGLCWSGLFIIDFSRLRNSQDSRIRPLVTIQSQRMDNRMIYHGLGYSVVYYLEGAYDDIYGLEVRVFGKMIMAWVK